MSRLVESMQIAWREIARLWARANLLGEVGLDLGFQEIHSRRRAPGGAHHRQHAETQQLVGRWNCSQFRDGQGQHASQDYPSGEPVHVVPAQAPGRGSGQREAPAPRGRGERIVDLVHQPRQHLDLVDHHPTA